MSKSKNWPGGTVGKGVPAFNPINCAEVTRRNAVVHCHNCDDDAALIDLADMLAAQNARYKQLRQALEDIVAVLPLKPDSSREKRILCYANNALEAVKSHAK